MLFKLTPGPNPELEEAEYISFSTLPFTQNGNAKEDDLENLIAENASLIDTATFDSDATLLIIGRQVHTKTNRRMDLVAIDGTGALILIEVKRDAEDVKARLDHAEIQSVRYAASLASLRTVDDLVTDIYGPYIARYAKQELESKGGGRTAEEWARKKLGDFMKDNKIDSARLNHQQQIVLIGASFDEDTKSAAAWLASNNVPIRVIEVKPAKVADNFFLDVVTVIPVPTYEGYYVDLVGGTTEVKTSSTLAGNGSRRSRIRLNALMNAGKLSPGDEIYFFSHPDQTAVLLDSTYCTYQGEKMRINDWAVKISGWTSVNIYGCLHQASTKKSFEDIRVELENELEQQEQQQVEIAYSSGDCSVSAVQTP